MLAAARVAKGAVRLHQRALVVAGQRQTAVNAVKRKQPMLHRGLQSLAQTDRVRCCSSFCLRCLTLPPPLQRTQ